jgi:hypothetical protein
MRFARIGALLAALPLAVAGCAATAGQTKVGANGPIQPDDSFVIVTEGKPTAAPSAGGGPPWKPSPHPTLPAVPVDDTCAFSWLAGQVLIPVSVEVGAGSAKVSWPRVGEPPPDEFRVAVVPQDLVGGAQPEPVWKTVTKTSGCSAETTFTGLTAGAPYVFWLDAPDSGFQPDGTPRPRSGRSTVFYPG